MYVLQHGVSLLITRPGEDELATSDPLQTALRGLDDVLVREAEAAKSLGAEDGHHEDSVPSLKSNGNRNQQMESNEWVRGWSALICKGQILPTARLNAAVPRYALSARR
ncbi:MAG: hypothetical protein ACTIIH_03655 [Brevibacterium sp.]|uniref:hypothetical protein n=1 Tax=Brevibacterium sp. TaxID=1701 RepID=UPI003F8F94A8